MSREIKFRAWLPVGEWDEKGEKQSYEMVYNLAYEEYLSINDLLNDTENIMQYTGLRDKNARDIWEGDIVKDIIMGKVGKIIFNDGCFEIYFDEHLQVNILFPYDYEIIGNIHENPELLEDV